jgi:hypothetical protein
MTIAVVRLGKGNNIFTKEIISGLSINKLKSVVCLTNLSQFITNLSQFITNLSQFFLIPPFYPKFCLNSQNNSYVVSKRFSKFLIVSIPTSENMPFWVIRRT